MTMKGTHATLQTDACAVIYCPKQHTEMSTRDPLFCRHAPASSRAVYNGVRQNYSHRWKAYLNQR